MASGKCLLLPGDHIIPNNLTMPVKRRKVLLAICRLAVVASCPTPRSPNQYLACPDACADAAQGRSRGTRHPCGRGACQGSMGFP